jgi:adenylate cyclase
MQRLRQLGAKLEAWSHRLPVQKLDATISILVTLAGVSLFLAIYWWKVELPQLKFIEGVELKTLDARFAARGAAAHDPRIVIVGIDEKTLQKVGAWPISRSAYAQLVDRLHEGGARVIGMDVTFPLPEKNSAVEALRQLETELKGKAPAAVVEKIRAIQSTSDNDVMFAEAMKRAGNVVLGHIFLGKADAGAFTSEASRAYVEVLSGKPFPQLRPRGRGGDVQGIDPVVAWREGGGQMYYAIEANMRLLADAARAYGYFNNVPDDDGIMRRHALIVYFAEDADWFGWYPSLPFQVLSQYDNVADQDILGYINPNGIESIVQGGREYRTRPDATVLVNYRGPYQTFQHYSMADVIDGTVPAETFKDKIVLVGATALGIGDMRNTPFGMDEKAYMGVEIHANVIDNMLHQGEPGRGFIERGQRQEWIDLLFIVLFGLGAGWVFGKFRPMVCALAFVVVLVGFSGFVYWTFATMGMWLSFVIPASVLTVGYASHTSFRMFFEEREKRKLRRSFSQYVSPGVIKLIEKDPAKYFRPGGEMREMTIMFSDIRSFTTISEGLTPDELVLLLNEYLGEMTDVIFARWGTLDKYIGDAIMAFWGSPYPQEDHATKACSAALDMIAKLDQLNHKWEQEGKKQLNIGIGLNTGPVNVGNMGSSKRLSWTVMGDHVNLASRLEGMTKEYKSRIVISEYTWQVVAGEYVARELDRIRVKGKTRPVAIYELMGYARDAAACADKLRLWEEAMNAYKRQNWPEAVEKFEALLERYPDDGPGHVLLKRSHEFLQHAPEPGWDGVYVMKEK